MKSNRPVNLPLATVIEVNMKSPVAIASILHRISGVVVFLLIPVLLYILQGSLSSEADFNAIKDSVFGVFLGRLVVFATLAGLIFHFLGIKHLLMDAGIAESLESGRMMAAATIAVSVVFILAAFVWVVL